MKNQIFYSLYVMSLVLLVNCSCREEDFDCMCKDEEECFSYKCYPAEWVHELGGTTLLAANSYVGIISNNECIDTLIFHNDTTRTLSNGQFGLYVPAPQGGIQNVADFYPTMVSDTEFYLGTSAPLCYLNGEVWYANLHFIIHADSVVMDLGFWTLTSEPGVIEYSSTVFFFKK